MYSKFSFCKIKISKDENYLAAGDDGNHFRLWDIRKASKPIINYQFQSAVKAIALSPKQTNLHIAVGTGRHDKRLTVFSKNSTEPRTVLEPTGQASGLIWPKSDILIVGDRFAKCLYAVDVFSGALFETLPLGGQPLTLVEDRNEKDFFVVSSNEIIQKFELPTLTETKQPVSRDNLKLNSTALNMIR